MAFLDKESRRRYPWWVWPAVMLGTALFCTAAALFLYPGANEFCYLPNGMQFGDECGFTMVTGLPCPQCGMTRSWVHGARFHWLRAFVYNPGGLTLFLWIQAAGVVGAVRLFRRDPKALTPNPGMLFFWTMFWLIGLYAIPWILRLNGFNELP